ncbi:MAG: DUF308 domain-containing protein [Oscillospiraceae bacterium]|nr:DUF308 domain-containing protein [Oscillospiraceae bacterium]
MKKEKISGVTASLILILLGLFMTIRPNTTITLVLRIVAGVLVFIGILRLYTGSKNKERTLKQNAQLCGAGLLCLAGLILFFIPGLIKNLFPKIIAVLIMILGIISLLNVLDAKDKGDEKWKVKLLFPLISIGCGVFILTFKEFILNTGIRLVGIFLMYQGGSQLFLEGGKTKGSEKEKPQKE